MFGPSYAVKTIKVADPFSFNFKLPGMMVKGDPHNITMTISNFNPSWTVCIPSVISEDDNVEVSFNYLTKNATGTNFVIANSYNVSANSTAYTAVFTVKALKETARAVVKIKLSGTTPDGKHNF